MDSRRYSSLIVALAFVATLSAQTKTPPPPSGTLISKCTVNCGTTGGTTGGTVPPAIPVAVDQIITAFRGNELSPNTQSGMQDLYSTFFPNVDMLLPNDGHGGMNCEHIIKLHGMGDIFGKPPGQWFSCRYGAMPATQLDARTVALTRPAGADPYFPSVSGTMTYHVEGNHVDLAVRWHVGDASVFYPEGVFGSFFSLYSYHTAELVINFLGLPAAGAPEQWIAAKPASPGGGYRACGDPDYQLNGFMNGTGNVVTPAYPCFTQPFYTVRMQTGGQMVFIFDRTSGIHFDQFRYFVKSETDPNYFNPALDFSFWVPDVQNDSNYGFNARLALVPSLNLEDARAEALNTVF